MARDDCTAENEVILKTLHRRSFSFNCSLVMVFSNSEISTGWRRYGGTWNFFSVLSQAEAVLLFQQRRLFEMIL